jgi:NitT/TauT family transport system substrate-binding protein
MSANRPRAALAGVLAIALAFGAACGGSGGEKSASGLERSEVRLGTMTVADTAPVQIALSKGLFKAEGLTVKTQVIQGGAAGVPLLKSGRLDFSFGNYVSLLTAGTKDPGFKPRIVAEGFRSAPRTHTLMVRGDSPYRTVEDLAGKKIGVNTKRNISTMLVRAAAQPQGVAFDEDKNFVEIAPPAMEQALKSGSVDAVQAIEPFGTQMRESMGARMVADLSTGETDGLPIAGYAATEKFVKKNPKTVAAFQRALQKAQGMAAGDRKLVQGILPAYAKGIDAEVAAGMSYGTYPTSIDTAALQRVADLMQRFQYVDEKIDVASFVAPAP